jgi:hypothetical protein
MKLLAVLILLGSCAHAKYPIYRNYKQDKEPTVSDRMESCMYRLVEKSGISAEKAQKACDGTFRRR